MFLVLDKFFYFCTGTGLQNLIINSQHDKHPANQVLITNLRRLGKIEKRPSIEHTYSNAGDRILWFNGQKLEFSSLDVAFEYSKPKTKSYIRNRWTTSNLLLQIVESLHNLQERRLQIKTLIRTLTLVRLLVKEVLTMTGQMKKTNLCLC